ncbi:MAG: TetR/AcrR family transcriptional regulator [Acidimicrobiia bacterium]
MTTERDPGGTNAEPGSYALRERILAATLVSLARYGVAKTTLEDVAKEAGCARATVYRYFGGKQQLLHAVVAHESQRVLTAIDAAARPGLALEDALVAMATTAAHELLEHDALQFVLAHEPELVLPFVTFDGSDTFIAVTGAALAPTFAGFLPAAEADRAAQWCIRVFLAYLGADDSPVTMTDAREVRALVHDFIAPALRAPASQPRGR